MASLYENRGNGEKLLEDPSTKKVPFKDTDNIPDVEMVIESPPVPAPSWKDIVFGKDPSKSKEVSINHSIDGDFSLLEGDDKKSIINCILIIDFLDRVQNLLVKDMFMSVILNLLGTYSTALQNKVYGLWRPSQPFQLMDIENNYFLAKFKNSKDYGKVLTQGPEIIFRQYLTIQPWTVDFCNNPFSVVSEIVVSGPRF
ncbi:hypothetical protein Golax_003682 [Gossypium laxum]|uniref:DUF4283 domain-containing protein n=1 Tax=Gossypium laxum TaxID=34288 RepID=A0A7J9AG57_9ROSI|nr:hypothetical protein [Gossypium laxum]